MLGFGGGTLAGRSHYIGLGCGPEKEGKDERWSELVLEENGGAVDMELSRSPYMESPGQEFRTKGFVTVLMRKASGKKSWTECMVYCTIVLVTMKS